jgi:crotonobetainyl-CoA:carnitine CoA-transferase CaiB-like acyl-CoA transferase
VIAEVNSLAQALDGELVLEREMIASIDTEHGTIRAIARPIRFSDSTPTYQRPPLLGEHTDALLHADSDD